MCDVAALREGPSTPGLSPALRGGPFRAFRQFGDFAPWSLPSPIADRGVATQLHLPHDPRAASQDRRHANDFGEDAPRVQGQLPCAWETRAGRGATCARLASTARVGPFARGFMLLPSTRTLSARGPG